MPARTRPAASTVTEVMETEEPEHQIPGLQFNEPLSWRAGKPIAVADLLRRLQALSIEMRDMEQEENERESFTHVAKELASPNLLAHKDKGVKAWTACCLVDILRLCAPDAPYTGQQLRASGRCQELESAAETNSYVGHLYHADHFDLCGSVRPIECIQ